MRTLAVLALISGGCSKLLGISDPVASGDGGSDAQLDDAGNPIDGPPPCIAPPSFAPPDSYALSDTPGLLATGDFDRDGKQDVAIALTANVLILHGDGQGKLERPQELATAADGVLSDDFDNDGLADLVLWTVGGSSVVLRRQDSTAANRGQFLAEQPLPGPFQGLRQVKSGLLGGNFVASVVTQDDVERRVYTANLGTLGTFSQDDAIGAAGDQLLQAADINTMQNDDIALVTASGGIEVAPQLSGGRYDTPIEVARGAAGLGAGFGQLDGDGAIDLIVATPDGGVVYRQTAPGKVPTFTRAPGAVAGVTGSTLQIVDVDHDGRDDIVVADGIVQQCAPGMFSALVPIPTTRSTLLRDLNKNGKPDLLRIIGGTLEVRVQ